MLLGGAVGGLTIYLPLKKIERATASGKLAFYLRSREVSMIPPHFGSDGKPHDFHEDRGSLSFEQREVFVFFFPLLL